MKATFINPQGLARTRGDRVITCVGVDHQHYREQSLITQARCTKFCPEVWQSFYTDYPSACPPQSVSPYGFKVFAIERCREEGFTQVLWMDSSVGPVRPLKPLWDVIDNEGWYVSKQGDSKLGTWCSDRALKILDLSRDHAMMLPLTWNGLFGFDFTHPIGLALWKLFVEYYSLGIFEGPYYNRPGQTRDEQEGYKWVGHCSLDPRVEGHRHDEVALSAALYCLHLRPQSPGLALFQNPDGVVGHHAQGVTA